MEVGKQAWNLSRWGAVESSLQGLPEGKLRQWSDQGTERGKERPQETCPFPHINAGVFNVQVCLLYAVNLAHRGHLCFHIYGVPTVLGTVLCAV